MVWDVCLCVCGGGEIIRESYAYIWLLEHASYTRVKTGRYSNRSTLPFPPKLLSGINNKHKGKCQKGKN